MSHVFAYAFLVAAFILAGLVLTKKVQFPLLFELGIALVAIGAVLIGEAVKSDVGGIDMAWRGIPMTLGALLIWASSRREKRKRAKTQPEHLDAEHWQHVHGRGRK